MINQRISAAMLAVTPTFKRIAALLAAGTGIEYFLFRRAMKAAALPNDPLYPSPIPAFERILEAARPEYVLLSLFLCFSALFLFTGCEQKGGKMAYTLQRLSVGERCVHLLWAVYYSLCYLLLLLWQAGMIWLFYRVYAASPFGEGLSPSGFFLATYRSDLLHSLLPLHDWARQLRNALLLPCLGISASVFSYHQRHGHRSLSPLLLVGMTAVLFVRPMARSAFDVFTMIYTLWLTATALNRFRRDPDDF